MYGAKAIRNSCRSPKIDNFKNDPRAVQPFEQCLIHLFDCLERTITKPYDALVPEVKVGSEPGAWYGPAPRSKCTSFPAARPNPRSPLAVLHRGDRFQLSWLLENV